MSAPYLFHQFIESGLEESKSPFLKKSSLGYAKNIPLKLSIISAVLLLGAFISQVFFQLETISSFLLLFVFLLAGIPSLIGAIEDLMLLVINIDILMTLAAFLSILIGSSLEGALLLVLFSLSGSIEESVTAKAKGAISSLQDLAPSKALVLDKSGNTHEKSVRDITAGMHILVRSGDVVPLDGILLSESGEVSLQHLTGESLPVKKLKGNPIAAGSRTTDSLLELEVTHTSSDSTLSKLIDLITLAGEAKPKLQRFIDQISSYYAITIISLSTLFALFIPFFFNIPYLGDEGAIYRALAFLIAASPCALIIAIPVGYLSAISACAKQGILLKGGITLDRLASCHAIAFDKTGTLTLGELSLTKIEGEKDDAQTIQKALQIACSLERGSSHPIATALLKYAEENKIQLLTLDDYKVIPGKGVTATYQGASLFIGRADTISSDEQLVALLEIGNERFSLFFQDTPRKEIASLLHELKERFSLKLYMLTGDHQKGAEAVAKKLPLDGLFADLLPEQKLEIIEELSKTQNLAMVGDGINDAPALARATASISMGKVGSTTAVDASDIVLLHDNISLLTWLMQKAHTTKKVIMQNVVLAFSVILFASLPALFGIVPLWLAVTLHEGGTVIVGLNSLRLLRSTSTFKSLK